MNTVCSATHVAAVVCRSHTTLVHELEEKGSANREIDGLDGEAGHTRRRNNV